MGGESVRAPSASALWPLLSTRPLPLLNAKACDEPPVFPLPPPPLLGRRPECTGDEAADEAADEVPLDAAEAPAPLTPVPLPP